MSATVRRTATACSAKRQDATSSKTSASSQSARRVKEFAREGAERIAVVCPGFVCDCLETIQEINDEGRADFLEAGGKSFTYIPCLNSSTAFVTALSTLLDKTIAEPSALLSAENQRKYKY